MRALWISVWAAAYLYGASEPQSILSEVTKLRQKYEECRQGQSAVLGIEPKLYQQCETERRDATGKIKGYQSRIANLETQVREDGAELSRLQKQNTQMSRELSQKQGVIKSLEQTLTSRDKKYREAVERNELLSTNIHTVKVSKIERESLKRALVTAKEENERLERELKKIASVSPAADANLKLQAMSVELSKAQALIAQLKSTPSLPVVQEKIVYKDRPVVQEKIVTKVVEPTEKIKALQHELATAQATIANLKNTSGTKVVIKEKIVPQEKVVYKDRVVTHEKIVYKDRPVVQEKIVYKDRPVIQEKIVTKVVEPTEKIKALQHELATAEATIANLKNTPVKVVVKEKIVPQEKVVYKDRIVPHEKIVYKDRPVVEEKIVYKDRPVIQEKIVYKDRPVIQEKVVYKDRPVVQEKVVEKVVIKVDEATRRQMDKLALELERQKTINQKLSSAPAPKPALTPLAAPKPMKAAISSAVQPKPAVASNAQKKKGSAAYRMAVNAPIYNGQGGAQVDMWEARRSFTAGEPDGGWVRITGYFVNRVWQPTGEDEHLWVKESDVIRR